jgi:hypothetical protein
MVSALKSDQSLKTTIGEDVELCFPIRTGEAFLMHVSTALMVIEKRGTFKAYKEACKAYVEQGKAEKQLKVSLALLMATVRKGKKSSKKSSKKASEQASQKTKKGEALANAPAPELRTEYQADYKKAKFAAETTKNKRKATATKIFSSMKICCLRMPSTRGTGLSRSKQRQIHSRIFQACPGKAKGDFRGSHLMTASCFIFSLCFQTMQLSKKITTFP